MSKQNRYNILLLSPNKEIGIIKSKLLWDFNVICQDDYNDIVKLLKMKKIKAIISYIRTKNDAYFKIKERICYSFHTIPKIAIINDHTDIELIRKCGEIGINSVIPLIDIQTLNKKASELIQKTIIKISFEEIGIETDNLPQLLKTALFFMESNYIQIMCIEEVINFVNTSYKTLSTLFKQANIINPKAVLMFLKIRHSLYLLKQNNLSIKEIAYKSGFSDQKRFSECFKRMFGKPPGEYLSEIYTTSIKDFWLNNLKYKLLYCSPQ